MPPLSKDRHEFLPLLAEIEEEPASPLGRMIFWIVMASILFFVLWMVFGRVDVVVSARGKVIPVGEVKTVQPLTTGVVRSILVKTGDRVHEGQVLMEIDPSDVAPGLASMQKDQKTLKLEILRLQALISKGPFAVMEEEYPADAVREQEILYDAAKDRIAAQIQVKIEALAQISRRLAGEQKLLEEAEYLLCQSRDRLARLEPVADIISRDEFEKAKSDAKTRQSQRDAACHRIEEFQSGSDQVKKEMELIQSEEKNRLLAELTEKRQKLLYLSADIEKNEFLTRRQQIVSPVDGHVSQLLIHTVGGVVTPAEKLAQIVPESSPMVIKAYVKNQDVGFVTSGMTSILKIDAFNYQKYGMIAGQVLQISQDSLDDPKMGLVYEVYISPEETSLKVEGDEKEIAPKD
ncbi:MAG: HlyD family type I secretion periplasmic adaptor subunit, partial [Desulfobacterales bacterium]|nr:HlyD family type I secretion periplasmic adaptor subunit [Desulfobacterales bacterium]